MSVRSAILFDYCVFCLFQPWSQFTAHIVRVCILLQEYEKATKDSEEKTSLSAQVCDLVGVYMLMCINNYLSWPKPV